MEIWKDIPGYEGLYQASSFGNVKSLKFSGGNKEKVLKPSVDSHGYLRVDLCRDGNAKNRRIHQLVAECFLDHKTDGTQKIVIDHINNIKTDNRAENLQLTTNRNNTSKDKKDYTSQYTGVCWFKQTSKWKASIRINGKSNHIGYFTCEIEASNAYQLALKELVNG